MKTLILGANGLLGHALQDVFPEAVAWGISDFAKKILELKNISVLVAPVRTNEFGFKRHRPEFAILLNNKASSLRHWELALKEYLGVN